MLCISPYRPRKGAEFGCGRCLPCRINRRRMWTARSVLESLTCSVSSFITLTYDEEHIPPRFTLVPGHVEEFRYKARYRWGPFRYYFVGEYGTASWRPHYHALLFGLAPSLEELTEVWGKGRCHVGICTPDSAAYCAGYVTKKMTSHQDERLIGRHPEFARMSRKPGLGTAGLEAIKEWCYSSEGAKYIGKYHDVPGSIRFEGKIYPLGRYLLTKLREEFDISAQDPVRSAQQEERRIQQSLPELVAAREFRREAHYQRAHFYVELRESMQKL